MIVAAFFRHSGNYNGFSLTGHAGWADAGEDIVCAAVTSAVQLTANGITEILNLPAKVTVKENTITLQLDQPQQAASQMIAALYLHLTILSEEYENTMRITVSEVS